ncbi:MAG: hypothetical protein E6J05_12115 [Chloroflexi bacterium]|nr:MAG: hypothetical protein E6J05_12115 [Chloroflexota bacterium]
MSWFADLTPYTYHEHVGGEPEPNTLNIGWLDTGMEFSTGECDRDFVARLRDLCRDGVNRTRGLYRCNLCSTSAFGGIWPPESNRVASPGGDFVVGGAEIRVTGADGTVYAAPDMIIHYVERHQYKPPEQFVAAVIDWT